MIDATFTYYIDSVAKGASISGFPEWLPSERVVEQRVIDTLREVFELNGFLGIETRAVETGASLLKKGETSKEIYLLSRLQDVGNESDTPIEERLGLHFDLTVPLSRYVVEHSGDLAFPFKRWQIQKVWRGERPQEGRFREFVQADIDVIGNGDLPDHYEVELPLVMVSALERLREFGLPKATVHANNRKLSEGFYRGLGLDDIEGVLREIDKLDKIGADEVAKLLVETCGATDAQARACLELAELTAANGAELAEKFDELAAKHGISQESEAYALAREGLNTLGMIVDQAAAIRPGSVIAGLKIARGLDYYTKTVFEIITDTPNGELTVCGGGRYDGLVEEIGGPSIPAVGFGMGIERVLMLLDQQNSQKLAVEDERPQVFVACLNQSLSKNAFLLMEQFRRAGLRADMDHQGRSLKAQFKYADKLGAQYVAVLGDDEVAKGVVKLRNMQTRDEWESPLKTAPEDLKAHLEK